MSGIQTYVTLEINFASNFTHVGLTLWFISEKKPKIMLVIPVVAKKCRNFHKLKKHPISRMAGSKSTIEHETMVQNIVLE